MLGITNNHNELHKVIENASEKDCRTIADWIERTSEKAVAKVLHYRKK